MSSNEIFLEFSSKSFDGFQNIYSHSRWSFSSLFGRWKKHESSTNFSSWTLECPMKFSVYVPSIADERSVPLLIFLPGSFVKQKKIVFLFEQI